MVRNDATADDDDFNVGIMYAVVRIESLLSSDCFVYSTKPSTEAILDATGCCGC
jgi:hypothetical protein